MDEMTVKILGCGASGGVPDVAYGWGTCDPANPKNCRTRSSILIQSKNTNLLVDTSPDLRGQLLNVGIDRVDAVFYTHIHADHTHGINELRGISQVHNKIIPVYGDEATIDNIKQSFCYLFESDKGGKVWYPPCLESRLVKDNPIMIGDISCTWLVHDHGPCNTLGLRIGKFAYTIDIKDMSQQNIESLRGVEVWIVECLRMEPHATHACLSQVLDWVNEIKPLKVFLINLGITMDYAALQKILPEHIVPTYDGMTINVLVTEKEFA